MIGILLEGEGGGEKLQSMRDKVHYCQLLTKVYSKTDRFTEAIEILEKGRGYQIQIVKRISIDEPDSVQAEKETLAK